MSNITTESVIQKGVLAITVTLLATIFGAAQEVPKTELYVGYSFLHVNSAVSVPSFTANGGLSSFQYNFNKNFSAVGEFGGVHNGNINGFQLDSTMYTYLFGPRLYVHKEHFAAPFFETLFGGMHYTRSFATTLTVNPLTNAPINNGRIDNAQDAFAMAAGGGLDLRLGQHLAFRPVQLDYVLTRFPPLFIGGLGEINRDRNQNNLRYSTGFIFRFGGAEPPTPTASCMKEQPNVLPDDPPISLSVQPNDFNPKHPLTYQWESTGGKITGDGPSAKVDLANAQPGSYEVTSRVTDPKQNKNNVASCSSSFTVRQPQPPIVSCNASPNSIVAGTATPVTITAQGSTLDPRPIQSRKFSANGGSIQQGQTNAGASSGEWTTIATLDTTGVQPGKIDVNIDVADSRGLTANCLASVNVEAPPPPPPPAASEIGQCEFNNANKPARIDNDCKAKLDDAAIQLKHDPEARLVVVGFADTDEQAKAPALGALRAVSAKDYLTGGEGGQGIESSRVDLRKGEGEGKKAVFYFVPAGGSFTEANTAAIDEEQIRALAASSAKKK